MKDIQISLLPVLTFWPKDGKKEGKNLQEKKTQNDGPEVGLGFGSMDMDKTV